MSSDESDGGPQPMRRQEARAGSSKKKGLDNLHDGFFEESSSSSEDDGPDFKAEPLEFSSSESDDDKNSDVELKTSDEEQLLNLYDKKLRDKLSSKKTKNDSGEQDKTTSRIADYMKKMRTEEKKLANKITEGKASAEDIAKNRKNKEAILKKFDYKDQLKQIKNQGFLNRYNSSSSGPESGSESDGQTFEKIKQKPKPSKTDKKTDKAATSRELDIRKKIAEMKKMVGSPQSSDKVDEHLMKAKQRVAEWMKDEEIKSTALKEKFSINSKFNPEVLMKEISGRKPPKLKAPEMPKFHDSRHPLPPVKTKKTIDSVKNIKKEDVLQILRDTEPAPKSKKAAADKTLLSTLKKNPTSKLTSTVPSRLVQTKSEPRKITGKTEIPPQIPIPPTNKISEKKPSILKKPSLKKTTAK